MTLDPVLDQYGPWNPGLSSEIPSEYLPLCTLFRDENVSTALAKAYELADYCGLPATELVAFRPERLIVHELLIVVTTSLSVPDGGDYEDLGRNFREITSTILERYIAPHRGKIAEVFEQLRRLAFVRLQEATAGRSAAPTPRVEEHGNWWPRRVFGFGKRQKPPVFPLDLAAEDDRSIVAAWHEKSKTAADKIQAACFEALHRIATGVMARHGRVVGDNDLLAELAVTLVCNGYGSQVISEAIKPFVQEAISGEGYKQLPAQQEPIVMNVKGASASGKSTMRPLQRNLARRLDFRWEEFALISPDVWRKFLLDYGSLGHAYKYAAMLTGHELEIIDKKLDQRMRARAAEGEIPHLLIDRFRFDSFVPELVGEGSNRLLTRFGNLVYMFFLITPPEMTVERAWKRGLKVGRYKAVEDILAHNVEAYTGMPELFFTWALAGGKRVHYEFLDNSVPEGQLPRTVAFGWNGEMTILDVKSMLNIKRFRKINIHATNDKEVYRGVNLTPELNTEFLRRCVRWIPIINLADHRSGVIYARLEDGKWMWRDEAKFASALDDSDIRAGVQAMAPTTHQLNSERRAPSEKVSVEKVHTIGAWGEEIPSV